MRFVSIFLLLGVIVLPSRAQSSSRVLGAEAEYVTAGDLDASDLGSPFVGASAYA